MLKYRTDIADLRIINVSDEDTSVDIKIVKHPDDELYTLFDFEGGVHASGWMSKEKLYKELETVEKTTSIKLEWADQYL